MNTRAVRPLPHNSVRSLQGISRPVTPNGSFSTRSNRLGLLNGPPKRPIPRQLVVQSQRFPHQSQQISSPNPYPQPTRHSNLRQNVAQNQRHPLQSQQMSSWNSPPIHQPVSGNSVTHLIMNQTSFPNRGIITGRAKMVTPGTIPALGQKQQVTPRPLHRISSAVQGYGPHIIKSTYSNAELKKNISVVLSCSIQGMRDWDQCKDQFHFLFEFIGSLHSAVTRNECQTGKSFQLKDATGTVKCIFYEVDRPLPKVVRGQFYRCVGKFNGRTRVVQCYSIRQASIQEIKNFAQRIEMSKKQMNSSYGIFIQK